MAPKIQVNAAVRGIRCVHSPKRFPQCRRPTHRAPQINSGNGVGSAAWRNMRELGPGFSWQFKTWILTLGSSIPAVHQESQNTNSSKNTVCFQTFLGKNHGLFGPTQHLSPYIVPAQMLPPLAWWWGKLHGSCDTTLGRGDSGTLGANLLAMFPAWVALC